MIWLNRVELVWLTLWLIEVVTARIQVYLWCILLVP